MWFCLKPFLNRDFAMNVLLGPDKNLYVRLYEFAILFGYKSVYTILRRKDLNFLRVSEIPGMPKNFFTDRVLSCRVVEIGHGLEHLEKRCISRSLCSELRGLLLNGEVLVFMNTPSHLGRAYNEKCPLLVATRENGRLFSDVLYYFKSLELYGQPPARANLHIKQEEMETETQSTSGPAPEAVTQMTGFDDETQAASPLRPEDLVQSFSSSTEQQMAPKNNVPSLQELCKRVLRRVCLEYNSGEMEYCYPPPSSFQPGKSSVAMETIEEERLEETTS